MTQTGLSCDITHLNPGVFALVAGIVSGFAGAVDVESLTGWSEVIDSAHRWSLPVFHLDDGRTRQGEG